MDTKDILLWAGFLAIGVIIVLVSHRMKKQIEANGIETTGVISRIENESGSDDTTLHYYARYRTAEGKEIEGVLSNPRDDLKIGQEVRLKYHPKFKTNARLVNR